MARRQRAYEAAIAAASAAAAEIKQKLQLREQVLKRPGLESVEFVFDPAKPTPLPEVRSQRAPLRSWLRHR